MPVQVLDRIIKASSNPGDIVLDPFNGSGTTVVSAALLGRKYVGIDQSAEYVKHAQQRVEQVLAGAKANGVKAGTAEMEVVLAAVTDPNRASRVQTETDAFGRPRVTRGRRAEESA
jgi:tRNA G10  N-methylase Trm11